MIFPTWIAANITPGAIGIWVLVIIALSYLFREWRLTRKLSLDDRLARRDGYAAQVASLQAENRKLRTEMDRRVRQMREESDAYRALCEAEHEQNRGEIRGLMDELAGYRRQRAHDQVAEIRAMPDSVKSPAVMEAAERLAEIIERHDQENEENGDERAD